MATTTLFAPELFVPSEVSLFSGEGRIPARIKVRPDHFQVEEEQDQQGYTWLCTVRAEPDLPADFQMPNGGVPGLVAFTLAKRCLKTYDAVQDFAKRLGVETGRVSYAGLKDRWAHTAQRCVVDLRGTNLTINDVRRLSCPEPLTGTGWFIKDVTTATRTLNPGQLLANRFTLVVLVNGMDARRIREYVGPRLATLERNGWGFPNGYGRQRLGQRQNLFQIGQTLITQGAEAAMKRFLCETVPGTESAAATKLRERLGQQWLYFPNMLGMLEEPVERSDKMAYQALNMGVEYDVVNKILELGSFDKVMSSGIDIFSLMIGAYQAFWFNQILARVIRKEIDLGERGAIPLFVCDKKWDRQRRRELPEDGDAISFYRKYMPEAIPPHIDPEVRRVLLSPRRNRWGEPSIPWRQALIPVRELKHRSEDGAWHCQFKLRSGSYATTFLGGLFDLDQEDEGAGNDRFRGARHQERWRGNGRGFRGGRR